MMTVGRRTQARSAYATIACFLALLGMVIACRFNVRDVGFVDLGAQQYRFYCHIDPSTPAETATAIKEISAAAFFNTNVEPEILNPSDANANQWRSRVGDPTVPTGILVSPDGKRSMALPLVEEGENLQDALWTNMEAVFESPTRGEVIAKAIDTYGVIVLVEGNDPAENSRLQQIAHRVIARIEDSLGSLEKEIQKPPVLHVISSEQAASEEVFLWSLGIDAGSPKEPFVSVIYARGRQIGQGLKGEEIDEKRLFNVLRTIGLNCECGLDRSWMQGPMMPLKWDSDTQARVAKQLGFDAEDPLIKMEMSQILSKGDQARKTREADPSNASSSDLDGFLANYEKTKPEEPSMDESDSEKLPKSTGSLTSSLGFLILASLLFLVLATGAFIIFRARSLNR